MLQRIQTVFLALVALCMLLTLFFPLWVGIGPMDEIIVTAWGMEYMGEEVAFPFSFIAVLAIASVVVAIMEITRYNNRLLQMKLGALNSLFMAGTVILAFWLIRETSAEYDAPGEYMFAIWMPVIAMLFNVLANRFIRRDEKLVRSADRIR